MWPSPTDVKPVGDAEAAIIDILVNTTSLTELLPADNIAPDLNGWDEGVKWVLISREGGPGKPPLDYPRIDIQTFADRRSVAFDLMSIAYAAVVNSPGYVGHGLIITAAQEEVGPVRSTDRNNASERYFGSIRLTTRAIEVES